MGTPERIRLGYSASNVSQRLHSGKELRVHPMEFRQVRGRLKTNIECLTRILGWNHVHGIRMFRVGVGFVTKPHRFDYRQLLHEFGADLANIREICSTYGMRLTLHGITKSLGNPDDASREQGIAHLVYCSNVLDAIGSDDSVIVQHLGGIYKQRYKTRERIVVVLKGLPTRIRERLLLENDDKWSVNDAMYVARNAQCGFVYDIHHHKCFPMDVDFTNENIRIALKAAKNTALRIGKTPKVHISSQNPMKDLGGHSDLIDYRDYAKLRQAINDVDFENVDIMIEAGLHEQAVLSIFSQTSARKPDWSIKREGHLV